MFKAIFGQGISQILVSINIMIKAEEFNRIWVSYRKNPKLSFSTVSFKHTNIRL